jgi:hypothetical protein
LRSLKVVIGVCIAVFVSFLFTACGGGGGSSTSTGDALVTSSTQSQSVQYTLSAKDVSKQGDGVPITFTITNNGDTPLNVIPLISVYKNSTEVWTLPAFRNSGGGILPGSTNNTQITWNQMDNSGNPVAPSTYIVKGTTLPLLDSEQVTIIIQ